ncbi:MAG: hypothetical protein Q9222_001478 [Ikaeria aurantiellina]
MALVTSFSQLYCSYSPTVLRKHLAKARSFPAFPLHASPEPLLTQQDCVQQHLVSTSKDQASEPNPSSTTITPRYLPCSPQNTSSYTASPQKIPSFNTKYAHQGLTLLQTSLQETNQDPQFARRLYLHALIYLLQGLQECTPSLSEYEVADLRTALPSHIITAPKAAGPQAHNFNGNRPHNIETATTKSTTTTTPSLLHRTLSLIIFSLILLTQFLLPYIRSLISTLAFYDREYAIHTRLTVFAARCARSSWALAISTLDPELVAWVLVEVTEGMRHGWARGTKRKCGTTEEDVR